MQFNAVLFEQRVTEALRQSPKPDTTNCLGFVWWCLDLVNSEEYISPSTSGDYLFQFESVPLHEKDTYSYSKGDLGLTVVQLPRRNVVHAAVFHPSAVNTVVHRRGYNSRVETVSIMNLKSPYDNKLEEVYSYFVFKRPRN